ncbi:hypothetical protein D3C73_1317050 [compost metagenome]
MHILTQSGHEAAGAAFAHMVAVGLYELDVVCGNTGVIGCCHYVLRSWIDVSAASDSRVAG